MEGWSPTGLCPPSCPYSPNVVEQVFREVRVDGVLRSSGTKFPGELCRYAKIVTIVCSRLDETRTATPNEVDRELQLC